MTVSESQLRFLVELGNQYCNMEGGDALDGTTNKDPRKSFLKNKEQAILCYDTALKLAWKKILPCQETKSLVTIPDEVDMVDNGMLPLYLATILNNKAIIHLELAQLPMAYRAFTLSLRIKREHLHPTHPDICGMLHNIALTLQQMGKYGKAFGVYSECLQLKKHNWVDNMQGAASTINNLGMVCYRLHKRNQAIRLLNEGIRLAARQCQEKKERLITYNAEDDLINGLRSLGMIYFEGAEYGDAMLCYNQAMVMLKMKKEREPREANSRKRIKYAIRLLQQCLDDVKFEMVTQSLKSNSCSDSKTSVLEGKEVVLTQTNNNGFVTPLKDSPNVSCDSRERYHSVDSNDENLRHEMTKSQEQKSISTDTTCTTSSAGCSDDESTCVVYFSIPNKSFVNFISNGKFIFCLNYFQPSITEILLKSSQFFE